MLATPYWHGNAPKRKFSDTAYNIDAPFCRNPYCLHHTDAHGGIASCGCAISRHDSVGHPWLASAYSEEHTIPIHALGDDNPLYYTQFAPATSEVDIVRHRWSGWLVDNLGRGGGRSTPFLLNHHCPSLLSSAGK